MIDNSEPKKTKSFWTQSIEVPLPFLLLLQVSFLILGFIMGSIR